MLTRYRVMVSAVAAARYSPEGEADRAWVKVKSRFFFDFFLVIFYLGGGGGEHADRGLL